MNFRKLCRSVAVAGLLITLAAAAQDEQKPPATTPTPAPARAETTGTQPAPAASTATPAPADAAATPPAEGGEKSAEGDAQSPTRFIPTQKSTADNSATFPVDI